MKAALVLGLALVLGCGRESAGPVEEEPRPVSRLSIDFLTDQDSLAEFLSKSIEEPLPAGAWEALDSEEWIWLEIHPSGVPGGYRATHARRRGDDPTPVRTTARGTWGDEVLTLEPALLGDARWHLRRSGEESLLVPESRIRTGGSDDPTPAGLRFRRVTRAMRPRGPPWGGVDLPDETDLGY